MSDDAVLITGANGEIGHGLIEYLGNSTKRRILALDLQPLDDSLKPFVHQAIRGNILDADLINHVGQHYKSVQFFI